MASPLKQLLSASARVLIVEDEAIIARDIQLILQDLGHTVCGIAASRKAALQIVEREKPDAVLMDIRIQGDTDGIETADEIMRQHRVPVIYLTAYTDDETLERAKATEPFGYIAKPVTSFDINVAVAIALQRHQMQKQVEGREAWLSSVLRSVAEAVIICDQHGLVTFLNAAAEHLLGLSGTHWSQRSIDDIARIEDADLENVPLSSLLTPVETRQPQMVLGDLVRPDKKRTPVLASITGLQGKLGSGSVLVMRDVSALRAEESELRAANGILTQANQRLTLLSHSLSHDLKEPLHGVRAYSDCLSLELEGKLEGDAAEYLEGIKTGCQRMESVMSSMLEYYGATSLRRSESQVINARVPYSEALLNLRSAIEALGAVIETSELPLVYVHPTALMLVFQNLLSNAIKYCRHHEPFIRVVADCESSLVKFTVADNGSGFEANQAERIFELFKRAHHREIPGSGVGLATCRRLVEEHGGTIWAEAEPGKGARFHFTVPSVLAASSN